MCENIEMRLYKVIHRAPWRVVKISKKRQQLRFRRAMVALKIALAQEKQETKEGTVEHWGRASDNPVGGWYGLKNNFRGRFGMYLPPLMEALGLVELTHEKRGNKMKAK